MFTVFSAHLCPKDLINSFVFDNTIALNSQHDYGTNKKFYFYLYVCYLVDIFDLC